MRRARVQLVGDNVYLFFLLFNIPGRGDNIILRKRKKIESNGERTDCKLEVWRNGDRIKSWRKKRGLGRGSGGKSLRRLGTIKRSFRLYLYFLFYESSGENIVPRARPTKL